MTEFNLSELRAEDPYNNQIKVYFEKDVREAVRLLKENSFLSDDWPGRWVNIELINEIFGDKLI